MPVTDKNTLSGYSKKGNYYKNNASPHGSSPFFHLSSRLENLAFRFQFFSYLYFRLFYKNMLEQELSLLKMSQLPPGSRVLHIGCGSCPYTALFLAARGYHVEAWDCHPGAVKKARKLVQKHHLEDRVQIVHREGSQLNNSACLYEAIWVSLNVSPLNKVLKQAQHNLKEGGVLIYRMLPGWISRLCASAENKNHHLPFPYLITSRRALKGWGGISVMVKKQMRTARGNSLPVFQPGSVFMKSAGLNPELETKLSIDRQQNYMVNKS